MDDPMLKIEKGCEGDRAPSLKTHTVFAENSEKNGTFTKVQKCCRLDFDADFLMNLHDFQRFNPYFQSFSPFIQKFEKCK